MSLQNLNSNFPIVDPATGTPNDYFIGLFQGRSDTIESKLSAVPGTDNALVRFDGTDGLLQNSLVIVDDAGSVSNVFSLTITNDVAYGVGWNGSLLVPSQNAVYDQVELRATKATTITAGTGLSGGGDLSAPRTISLANTAVSPGTYGDATHVGQFTVDAQGRLVAASAVSITGGGGGSGSGVLVPLQTTAVTGASVASISFPSIPSGYDDLVLVAKVRGTAAVVAVNMLVRLNGDTTATYDWATIAAAAAGISYVTGVGSTSMQLGAIGGASAVNTNRFGNIYLEILGYANTLFEKDAMGNSWDNASHTAATFRRQILGGTWHNTAAISQLDLLMSSGNFEIGSTVTLYGRKSSGSASGTQWALVDDHTISVAEANHAVSVSAYDEVMVQFIDVTSSVSGSRGLQVSVDGGATYFSASGDYNIFSASGVKTAVTQVACHSVATTAARGGFVHLHGIRGTTGPKLIKTSNSTDGVDYLFTASNAGITHVRAQNSAGGNVTGGRIITYGR